MTLDIRLTLVYPYRTLQKKEKIVAYISIVIDPFDGYKSVHLRTDSTNQTFDSGDPVEDFNNAMDSAMRSGEVILKSSSVDDFCVESRSFSYNDNGYMIKKEGFFGYDFEITTDGLFSYKDVIVIKKDGKELFRTDYDELFKIQLLFRKIDDEIIERFNRS